MSAARPGEADPGLLATLAAAFRASPTPTLVGDPARPDHPVTAVNPAFEHLTGYASGDVVGRGWGLLDGPRTDRDAAAGVTRALGAGEGLRTDILHYRKDGSSFWNALAVSPVRDADGRLVAYFANCSAGHVPGAGVGAAPPDAAAGERSADAIEALVAERTRALRADLDACTALLHEVDHRTKNNLQVIVSLIHLKARRLREAGARTMLQVVAERVAALSAAHRLLRPVEGVVRLDLVALAADLAAELEAGIESDRIAVAVEIDPVTLAAEKAAPLALLLHELGTNALRHAFPEERRGTIAITARRRDATLTVTVADDGVGLSAREPNPEGYGRGLAEMMTRQMRGTLAWEDAAPGTRAVAALPLEASELG